MITVKYRPFNAVGLTFQGNLRWNKIFLHVPFRLQNSFAFCFQLENNLHLYLISDLSPSTISSSKSSKYCYESYTNSGY